MAGTHPDVLRVAKPEDRQELPIRVIRDLCIDLGLKPMSGRRKVAIVDDADDLNDEAANAFLKTLEEPPPGSTLILVGTSAEGQLDTILSRCRVVRFDPLPESELAEVLLEQGIVETKAEADPTRQARRGERGPSPRPGRPGPRPSSVGDSSTRSPPLMVSTPRALARRIEEFINKAGKEAGAKRVRARLIFGELVRLFRATFRLGAGLELLAADPDDAPGRRHPRRSARARSRAGPRRALPRGRISRSPQSLYAPGP